MLLSTSSIVVLSVIGSFESTSIDSDVEPVLVEWTYGIDELDAPSLDISMPGGDDISIELRCRLGFDGDSFSWDSELLLPDSTGFISTRISIPDEAYWDYEQSRRLSSMIVQVWMWKEDVLVSVNSPAPLRLAFPFGAYSPVFLDDALRRELAPGGVLLSSTEVGQDTAWETIDYDGE